MRPHPCASGKSIENVALKYAIDAGVRNFDTVIARRIPDDPDRLKVIFVPQIKHFLDDLSGRFIARVLWD